MHKVHFAKQKWRSGDFGLRSCITQNKKRKSQSATSVVALVHWCFYQIIDYLVCTYSRCIGNARAVYDSAQTSTKWLSLLYLLALNPNAEHLAQFLGWKIVLKGIVWNINHSIDSWEILGGKMQWRVSVDYQPFYRLLGKFSERQRVEIARLEHQPFCRLLGKLSEGKCAEQVVCGISTTLLTPWKNVGRKNVLK